MRRRELALGFGASMLSGCNTQAARIAAPESFPSLGSVFRFPKQPAAGFHWPYYLMLPSVLATRARLTILGPNNVISSELQALEDEVQTWFDSIGEKLAEPLQGPILIPLFIRPPTDDEAHNLYTHALSRAALMTQIPELARLDLQILAMVDDAVRRLGDAGLPLADNSVLACGYSAQGSLAQRLGILHPDRVTAAAVGGAAGMPTLPVAEIDGEALTYPVGVADLQQLAGATFDAETYRRRPLLIVQGEADDNDAIDAPDSFTAQQSELVRRRFGARPIDRVARRGRCFRTLE